MVIGGQAVLLNGEPRMTRDIDVNLGVDIDRIDSALEAFAVPPSVPFQTTFSLSWQKRMSFRWRTLRPASDWI